MMPLHQQLGLLLVCSAIIYKGVIHKLFLILFLAANKSQKGNHKDVREVVQYNDELFPLSDF